MLEHVPAALGRALETMRAGLDKIVFYSDAAAAAPDSITLSSPAFADGGALPSRFTEDGTKISPPLQWKGVPANAASLVLFIEDPDAPTPEPLVHCIACHLPPGDGELPEAALKSAGAPGSVAILGKNSFLKAEYLPPDPPTGHGLHRYVFQIFALDHRLDVADQPGRGAVVKAMAGHVLAKGMVTGTYERA